jgi:hypothetical protein
VPTLQLGYTILGRARDRSTMHERFEVDVFACRYSL